MFNQFTEQFSINEMAEVVRRAGAQLGLRVRVEPIENPRVEADRHYYNARHRGLLELGLRPHFLSETLVESMLSAIARHQARISPDHIVPNVSWRPAPPLAAASSR